MNFLQLMAFGFLCALLQATIPPFVWLIMGNFVTISINREVIIKNKDKKSFQEFKSANVSDSDDLDKNYVNSATPIFVSMIVLSVTMFFAAFFQVFLNNLQKERRFSASLLGNIRSSSNIPNQNSLYSEITAYGHCLVGVPPVGTSGRHVT